MIKIIKLALLILGLVVLTSCESTTYKEIEHQDIIVDKEVRSELNNVATWFFNKPMSHTVYYFSLKEYRDIQVDSSTYNHYKIGDTYTWRETVIVYESKEEIKLNDV